MIHFLFFTPIGWVLIATYLFFVGLLVWLIIDLRSANFMPADFVERLDEHLRNKQLKEGFELAKAEPSPFGKVMTAGMARLSAGLTEARDAAEFMIESAKNRKDALLGYMAVLGTLGPLIGLVGTVSGMIDTFAVLGTGTTPNVGDLARGISHALNATLVGIFLSVLAIPVFTYFKNRLSRIVIDASLLADDLLTQTYYSSRKPEGPSVTGTAAQPARAVPLPPKPESK
jgi:biopolymer transport protein ExbB